MNTETSVSQWEPLPRHQVHPENATYIEGVRCVAMPCCGFTYDAVHTDGRGLYSCPLCEPRD